MTRTARQSLGYAAGTSLDAFASRLESATADELDRLVPTLDRQVTIATGAGHPSRAQYWREVKRLALERRAELRQ